MRTNRKSKNAIILQCAENRLNLAQVNNIRKILYPLITQPNIQIILDLRYVEFMDCCAVSCIISMSQLARLNHTTLILRNLTDNVQLMTDILNLSQIIPIEKQIEHNVLQKHIIYSH